eukprot:4587650-Prymnesium_polylepis.2
MASSRRRRDIFKALSGHTVHTTAGRELRRADAIDTARAPDKTSPRMPWAAPGCVHVRVQRLCAVLGVLERR